MYAKCYVLSVIIDFVLGEYNILLLHMNDMHTRFHQTDKYSNICKDDSSVECYGGYARLRSEVTLRKKEAAAKGRPTIFLNAGDSFQGTPFYTYFKWPIVAKFDEMLGFDLMCLGNHEFDNGVEGVAPFISNVAIPVVCCNLDISDEPRLNHPNLTPSKILTVNGTRIGIIGYLTPETAILSPMGNVKILDEIPCIRAEAKKLLDQNVNIIIGLGHSGYTRDLQIAKEVSELDLVVGGHSHTFLYNGISPDVEKIKGPYPTIVTQDSGKQVPVVHNYFGTKYLGYLELDFDDDGNLIAFNGLPILLRGDIPQDPEIMKELKPYEEQISERLLKVIGHADVLLDNNDRKCKLAECNIGNLITDAYVDYVTRNFKNPKGWTVAAVGLNQVGDFRASINTKTNSYRNGSITVEDVITVLPWGGKMLIHTMDGSVLRQALEFSVARYEQTITGHVSEFLQVSGLKVVYNMNNAKDNRVVSVLVRCANCEVPVYYPLQLTESYRVVMPEYVGSGGDGYYMFANLPDPVVLDDVDYMVVCQYIQAHSPVYPAIEGRITIDTTDLSVTWNYIYSFMDNLLCLANYFYSEVWFHIHKILSNIFFN